MYSHANKYLASYVDTGNESQSGIMLAITILGTFVFLFMLLPTLNLWRKQQHHPHHGALVGNWRTQGIRRLIKNIGLPVYSREYHSYTAWRHYRP